MEIHDDFDESANNENLPLNNLLQNEKDKSENAVSNENEQDLVHLSTSSCMNLRQSTGDQRFQNDTKMILQNKKIDVVQIKEERQVSGIPMCERPQFNDLSTSSMNRILMSSIKGYLPQQIRINHEISQLWINLVYVSYQMEWERLQISDQFLWPKINRSVSDMKIFAIDFLADFLKKDFHNYESHQIERPQLSYQKGKEHLFEIKLDIKWDREHLKDKFLWDISDPDNSPEEFACQMTLDLKLPSIFQTLIALQIRRQISNYSLKAAQIFTRGVQQQQDFDMPITFVSLKQQSDHSYQISQSILPKKRPREESETEDLIYKVGLALKNKNYQPAQMFQNPNKEQVLNLQNEENSSNKMTPVKIINENSSFSSPSSLQGSNTKIQIKNLMNGGELHKQVSQNEKKRTVKELAKDNQSQITIILQADSKGLYSISAINAKLNNKIKISVESKGSSTDQNKNLIKIPHLTKDGSTIGHQLQSFSDGNNSSSKIQLDRLSKSPQKVDLNNNTLMNDVQYNSNNHLISIDLKSLYSNGCNSSQEKGKQLNTNATNQLIECQDEVETNGNGSISTKPKQISISEAEELDHSDNVHSQNAVNDDQLFKDFE